MGYIHFGGHWKGWALTIETFSGPPLPMALEMDVAHIKIISSLPIKKVLTTMIRRTGNRSEEQYEQSYPAMPNLASEVGQYLSPTIRILGI